MVNFGDYLIRRLDKTKFKRDIPIWVIVVITVLVLIFVSCIVYELRYSKNKVKVYKKEYKDVSITEIARIYESDVIEIININGIIDYDDYRNRTFLFIPIDTKVRELTENNKLLIQKIVGIEINETSTLKNDSIISSLYGERQNPFKFKIKGLGGGSKGKKSGVEFHKGLDLKANTNTPLFINLDNAVVVRIGKDEKLGKFVGIIYRGVKIEFYHLDRIIIEEGTIITSKTLVGYTGESGRSTGPHLHISMFMKMKDKWQPIDPLDFWRDEI